MSIQQIPQPLVYLEHTQADARKSVPKLDVVELVAANRFRLSLIHDLDLSLADPKALMRRYHDECNTLRTINPQAPPVTPPKCDTEKYTKNLHEKAMLCSLVVSEALSRSTDEVNRQEMELARVFLVREIEPQVASLVIDAEIVTFTSAVRKALDLKLSVTNNEGLFVQIGTILEGSNRFDVRGSRRSEKRILRELIVKTLIERLDFEFDWLLDLMIPAEITNPPAELTVVSGPQASQVGLKRGREEDIPSEEGLQIPPLTYAPMWMPPIAGNTAEGYVTSSIANTIGGQHNASIPVYDVDAVLDGIDDSWFDFDQDTPHN